MGCAAHPHSAASGRYTHRDVYPHIRAYGHAHAHPYCHIRVANGHTHTHAHIRAANGHAYFCTAFSNAQRDPCAHGHPHTDTPSAYRDADAYRDPGPLVEQCGAEHPGFGSGNRH